MSDRNPEDDKAKQEKYNAAIQDFQGSKKAQGLGDARGEENLSYEKTGGLSGQSVGTQTQHETPRPPARGLNAESRTGVTNKQAKPSQSQPESAQTPANPYGANPPSSQAQEQTPTQANEMGQKPPEQFNEQEKGNEQDRGNDEPDR